MKRDLAIRMGAMMATSAITAAVLVELARENAESGVAAAMDARLHTPQALLPAVLVGFEPSKAKREMR